MTIDDAPKSCACLSLDAGAAAAALRYTQTTAELVDESHLRVTIRRCLGCGQEFVRVFTELVDFSGGDDSQAWTTAPIDGPESAALRAAAAGAQADPGAAVVGLVAALSPRRTLYDVHPRGGTRGQSWHTGPITIFPHD